jgi:hypothetical protein
MTDKSSSLLLWAGTRLGVLTGDNAANQGQCVGLVEAWLDHLGKPHVFGNAKDLLREASTAAYMVVVNTPNNFPKPGDIIVWGSTWGNGFGHTAIVLAANVYWVAVLEQNDPTGAMPVAATHGYSGVIGWLTW